MSNFNDRECNQITKLLIDFILTNYPSQYHSDNLPLNQSLLELGVLDSYAVIELVQFIESSWGITVEDYEINKENLGSIINMTNFVYKKIKKN